MIMSIRTYDWVMCIHLWRFWVAAYKKDGADGLVAKSTRPKTQPNETPIRVKETIIALRKKENICALKLKWKIEKKGVVIHERTIVAKMLPIFYLKQFRTSSKVRNNKKADLFRYSLFKKMMEVLQTLGCILR